MWKWFWWIHIECYGVSIASRVFVIISLLLSTRHFWSLIFCCAFTSTICISLWITGLLNKKHFNVNVFWLTSPIDGLLTMFSCCWAPPDSLWKLPWAQTGLAQCAEGEMECVEARAEPDSRYFTVWCSEAVQPQRHTQNGEETSGACYFQRAALHLFKV